jgi:hypothetical protein
MRKIGLVPLIFLVALVFDATAQESSTKPKFLGLWQNAHSGGRCQFFDSTVTITLANASEAIVNGKAWPVLPVSNEPGRENQLTTNIANFTLINDSEMIYYVKGPDGVDQCRFIKDGANHQTPQP